MKKRRKTDKCLNCGNDLKSAYNFCPECGQENNNNQVSFGQLLKDFFANYFSLDSRFGRSFKPFFIQPGTLTREFMEGRRVKYANPIRLYLVISLIHFFVFSISSNNEESERSENTGILQNMAEDSVERKNTIRYSFDTDSLNFTVDSLPTSVPDSGYFVFEQKNLDIINGMSDDYATEEILDSLNTHMRPFWEQVIVKQIIKTQKKGNSTFMSYVIKNIPILMFFLLPIYALILKVFFRKRLYINHVVHSLHVHSFLFVVLTPFWLYSIFKEPPGFLGLLIFLGAWFYLIVSFRNTYNIRWRTSIFKVFFSGWIYSFVLLIAMVFIFIISFLTF